MISNTLADVFHGCILRSSILLRSGGVYCPIRGDPDSPPRAATLVARTKEIIIMYSVANTLDGKYVLTYSGWEMAFWFSDFQYDTAIEAFNSPDRFDFR
jgi:hypothetical protein